MLAAKRSARTRCFGSNAAGSTPGIPGQFFMLEAPGRVLPRPMSLCLAPPGELAFLIDPVGPGTRALCALESGQAIHVLGPLGNGFDLSVERPLLVAGGIGIAPMPYLADALSGRRSCDSRLPQRSARRGCRGSFRAPPSSSSRGSSRSCLPDDPGDVLACGPEPMLEAVRALVPRAQLAWEAPMACGYGGCYGCVVERDGRYVRLCIEGPVLQGAA